MRKVLISLAAAGTAMAFAAPASAQYFPQSQPAYGYGNGGYGNGGYGNYGGGYGYNQGGQVRGLQIRIDQIQRQIEQLGARGILNRNELNGLRNESRRLEQRLYSAGRYGLDRNETRDIYYRIARLEQHVRHEATDGNRYGYNGYNSGYGYNGYNGGYGNDRDHDGRDDNDEHRNWHNQHDGGDNGGHDDD